MGKKRVGVIMKKDSFIFVEYNNVKYPDGYSSDIKEVAAHFDKDNIEASEKYSLHTEYSYGKRKFDTELISKFPELVESQKDGVPQLWKSEEWASQFADFIIQLTADYNPPTTVEIHPPFNDYCTLDDFIKRYKVFESKIRAQFPNTNIVIENRAGAVYRGGKFLIGKAKEIVALCEQIKENNLSLRVVLDFPQLLTAENIDTLKFKQEKYKNAIDMICQYHDLIKGVHIWGKKKSETGRWVAHCGNFDTYSNRNEENIKTFINGIAKICNDEQKRFFVPEVNSGTEDLYCILEDLFLNIY